MNFYQGEPILVNFQPINKNVVIKCYFDSHHPDKTFTYQHAKETRTNKDYFRVFINTNKITLVTNQSNTSYETMKDEQSFQFIDNETKLKFTAFFHSVAKNQTVYNENGTEIIGDYICVWMNSSKTAVESLSNIDNETISLF